MGFYNVTFCIVLYQCFVSAHAFPLTSSNVSRLAEVREQGGGFDHGSFWQQQKP